MPALKPRKTSDSSDLLSGRQIPAPGGLSTANALAMRHFAGEGSAANPGDANPQDPRGRQLRQLRQQHNMDPATLASQACLSLRQLEQLETGADSLFYSPGLRNQAGRRVATILGTDWDRLGDGSCPPAHQPAAVLEDLGAAPGPDTPRPASQASRTGRHISRNWALWLLATLIGSGAVMAYSALHDAHADAPPHSRVHATSSPGR